MTCVLTITTDSIKCELELNNGEKLTAHYGADGWDNPDVQQLIDDDTDVLLIQDSMNMLEATDDL